MGFLKIISFQHLSNSNTSQNNDLTLQIGLQQAAFKKRRLNDGSVSSEHGRMVTVKHIFNKVKRWLNELGFKTFGIEHHRAFKEKLRAQIISKQMIREKVEEIDLRSVFVEIDDIQSMQNTAKETEEEQHPKTLWIAPNIVAPRFLIYATSKWTILVDEYQTMYVHHTFNRFYQTMFFGANLAQSDQQTGFSVSIIDGFLVPRDYFDKVAAKFQAPQHLHNEKGPPLQFWILDVLSYQNKTACDLFQRFDFLKRIQKSYQLQYAQNAAIPISIRCLHFESVENIKNLAQFVKTYKDEYYAECTVYDDNRNIKHAIRGLVVIKSGYPCVINQRGQYKDRCVVWNCDFKTLDH